MMLVDKRKKMIDKLISEGYIKSEEVKTAFMKIPREKFIPKSIEMRAYQDTPLEIGNGQTISAPHMVAIMCEALDIKKGQKILEIGTGSGYHAAIVAKMVSNSGKVYTIERHLDLAKFAENNLKKTKINNVIVKIGDGSEGLEEFKPYDRIYVTCASPQIPPPLIEQLKDQGKLLIPVGSMYCDLKLIEKKGIDLITKDFGGCVFVPLIGKYGH